MISSNSAYGNTANSLFSSLSSPEEMLNKTAETDGTVQVGVQKKSANNKTQASAAIEKAVKEVLNKANAQNQETENIGNKKNNEDVEQYYYHRNPSDITNSFDVLAAEIGAVGGKITKEQLAAYYQNLMTSFKSGEDNTQAIIFVKNLIAKFDTLSNGADYITSLVGMDEPQDYSTVTKEQVTPPIDLRI